MANTLRAVRLILLYGLGILVGLPLLVFLYAATINCFDESLSPTAEALLVEPPHTLRSEDNLYVALVGLQAPAGTIQWISYGQQRIDRYNGLVDRIRLADPKAIGESRNEKGKLGVKGDVQQWRSGAGSSWAIAKARPAFLDKALADNAELLARYEMMTRLRAYDETAGPSNGMPDALPPGGLHSLYLIALAFKLQNGAPAERRVALQALVADLAMWRAILTGQGGLLARVVAAAMINADDVLLGNMIADPALPRDLLDDELAAILEPFDIDDWRIGSALAADYRLADASLRPIVLANSPFELSPARPSSWFERQGNRISAHFFKLHATENLLAELTTKQIALANTEPPDFTAQLALVRDAEKRAREDIGHNVLYNPVGRVLVAIAANDQAGDYAARMLDDASMQRLVRCELAIRAEHIAAGDVPEFLEAHPMWCTHVIPGHPFHWDAKTHELAVNPLGSHAPSHQFGVVLDFL
jgi:hypothetical protein